MFSGSGTPGEAVLTLWDALGGCSGALGGPVGGVFQALGRNGAAREALGNLWGGSGAPWDALGSCFQCLGNCFSTSVMPWEAIPGLWDALGRPGKVFSRSGTPGEAVLTLWDALGSCSGALGRPGTPWEAVLRVWDVLGSCSEALGRPGGLFWGDPDPPRGARAEFSPDGPMVEVWVRFMEVWIHGGFELGAPWGPEGLPSSTGKHKENRPFRPPNADILEIPPS